VIINCIHLLLKAHPSNGQVIIPPAKFVCCMISIKSILKLISTSRMQKLAADVVNTVSSEKGGALVPSHLHDRSVAQHLLNSCSKPKPSSIAETCLILINLVFTWCHMQMSPLCCGWTSLRNYGTHHFRFLLLWSPGSALTIDGIELIVRRTGEYMHGIQISMF